MNKETGSRVGHFNKAKNRKQFLEQEIASTTDETAKLELTRMLLDMEKEERKRKYIILFVILLLVVGVFFTLFVLGHQTNKTPSKKEITQTTQTSHSETASSKKEETVNELKLSENQFKDWVVTVLGAMGMNKEIRETPGNPGDYYFSNVSINPKDDMVTVTVLINQTDSLGAFRVNPKGQLEASYRVVGGDFGAWYVVSNKFLDTSLVESNHYEKSEFSTFTDVDNNASEHSKNTLDLSEADIEKWIIEVMKTANVWDDIFVVGNFRLDDNQLITIQVGKYQTGSAYSFRINPQGELEAIKPLPTKKDWTVVSEFYMDTSIAVERFDEVYEKSQF